MFSQTNCGSNLGSHALVIGSSMAGLLASRVLANHFDQVTIVERDHFPEKPLPRKGVPQSQHLHVLLVRGRLILEQLFPGLQNELIAAGASVLDVGADVAWLTPAGWGIPFASGLATLTFSRDLLDWSVRRRLTTFTNIHFLQACDIAGLLPDATGVAGVLIRHNQLERTGEEPLYADLVVDASGRGSRVPQWLKALGYMPPQETVINAFLGYASRIYQRPSTLQTDWQAQFIQAAPPTRTRAGALFPLEGNRWIFSLCGGDRDYPPADEVGFLDFARSLPSPTIYNAIKDAEPLSPICSYRATANRLRHYERLPQQPEGLLVMGDAVCAFNPVYGQGMTIAALGAVTLDKCLREQRRYRPDGDLTGLARRFQKQLSRVNAMPWLLTTSEDYRYRGTEGKPPSQVTRLMHWYMDQVLPLTTKNVNVRLVFLEVMHMLKPSTALFKPSIIFQVLKQALRLPSRTGTSLKEELRPGKANSSRGLFSNICRRIGCRSI